MRHWMFAAVVVAALTATLTSQSPATPRFSMRVVASGLASPWEVTWGPDRQLWITERTGKRVLRIDPATGERKVALTIADVHQNVTQDGLLGLVLHPDFGLNMGTDFVFVAFTYDADAGPALARRLGVRRYRFDAGSLVDPVDILRDLPSHDDHIGGRITIGPERRLLLTIGDGGANFGQNRCLPNRALDLPSAADVKAANWSSYWGKILRLDLNGGIPADNPAIDGVRSHIYSYGHRNPLGLAFGPRAALYESEHGPSSDDEINLILPGRNYGWPRVAGYRDDKAYTYANWSASTLPCAELPLRGPGNAPPSVPSQAESTFTHPLFTPPLQTFFTVDSASQITGTGSATIAPGGLDVYTSDAIPGWKNSILALSLVRGVVYRLRLAPDGRSIDGAPIELLRTANRYRDIALHPDGRRIYLVTDPGGNIRTPEGTMSDQLANRASLLEFTAAP